MAAWMHRRRRSAFDGSDRCAAFGVRRSAFASAACYSMQPVPVPGTVTRSYPVPGTRYPIVISYDLSPWHRRRHRRHARPHPGRVGHRDLVGHRRPRAVCLTAHRLGRAGPRRLVARLPTGGAPRARGGWPAGVRHRGHRPERPDARRDPARRRRHGRPARADLVRSADAGRVRRTHRAHRRRAPHRVDE